MSALRGSATAVLERRAVVGDGFTTEPYELPWAAEARFFVHVFSAEGALGLITQVSPDGLHWCDLTDADPVHVDEPGLVSWAVTGFGQWLRIRVTATDGVSASVRVYLVGKS